MAKTNMIKKLITVLLAAVLSLLTVFAAAGETLPDGSVRLLPERLVVLDDSGRSVSDNGEYFFIVEGMEIHKTYTKKIQIMNLREDNTFRITMSAQPLFTEGEIDLQEECSCEILLGGETLYTGKITGEGSPDMRTVPLDIGSYAPSDSRTLTVNITWNGTEAGGALDNGHRLYHAGGTDILREASGKSTIHGETEFKWIFHAEIDDTVGQDTEEHSGGGDDDGSRGGTAPPEPGTGTGGISGITSFVKTGGVIAVGMLVVILAATLVLMVMLGKKKRKQ